MALRSFYALALVATSATVAALDAQLVGTWSTKSAAVFTGPGFYNPVNDSFIEPKLTGISYSFTSDGYYEEAYYRAISNPTNPKCPQAIMQFQHGSVVENADGSLTLTPISVDGRQLQSDPCDYDVGLYTRYHQAETMQKWQVYEDPYHQVPRLDLYQFNGEPLQPLYLAYSPPMMLPTITMNPTTTAASATATAKVKRGVGADGEPIYDEIIVPMNRNAQHIKRDLPAQTKPWLDANTVFWGGVFLVAFGGTAYML